MKTTIHKVQLALGGGTYEMPEGADPVHVGEQNGVVCLWYRCNPDAARELREYIVVGTGYYVGELPHIGSVVTGESLVWHVLDGGVTVQEGAPPA